MSVLYGGENALLLCAASYPLREGVNLLVITILKRLLVLQPSASPSWVIKGKQSGKAKELARPILSYIINFVRKYSANPPCYRVFVV